MKFKCNKGGVYVDGDRFLVGLSVSKEKMDMIEGILWDGVLNQDKYAIAISGGNAGNDDSSLESRYDSKNPEAYFYTPQVNDGFNHLDHCEPVENCCPECETEEILSDAELMSSIKKSMEQIDEGKGIPLSELFYDECPDWCEGVGDGCLDISWDVGVCDKCVEQRGVECGI